MGTLFAILSPYTTCIIFTRGHDSSSIITKRCAENIISVTFKCLYQTTIVRTPNSKNINKLQFSSSFAAYATLFFNVIRLNLNECNDMSWHIFCGKNIQADVLSNVSIRTAYIWTKRQKFLDFCRFSRSRCLYMDKTTPFKMYNWKFFKGYFHL